MEREQILIYAEMDKKKMVSDFLIEMLVKDSIKNKLD